MAHIRSGQYGTYYGSLFTDSEGLSAYEQQVNAKYIYSYLKNKGWTLNAISGMLGNIQAESSINPGRWQSEDVGNTSLGYGLVQWTPATKYFDWITEQGLSDASTMDNNLARIIYEMNNNLQWISTDSYPLSFKEFSTSVLPPEYLASAFLKNYERAGVEVEENRRSNARNWYDYLSGVDPTTPEQETTTKKKKKFNFLLFNKKRGIYQ